MVLVDVLVGVAEWVMVVVICLGLSAVRAICAAVMIEKLEDRRTDESCSQRRHRQKGME